MGCKKWDENIEGYPGLPPHRVFNVLSSTGSFNFDPTSHTPVTFRGGMHQTRIRINP
jgi:hypothetical protein